MSLINQVLRDLDTRHADADAEGLPSDVRSPTMERGGAEKPRPKGAIIGGLVLVVAVGIGAWWALSGEKPLVAAVPVPPPTPILPARPPQQPPVAVARKPPEMARAVAPSPPAAAPHSPFIEIKPTPPAQVKITPAVSRERKTGYSLSEGGAGSLKLATTLATKVPDEPVSGVPIQTQPSRMLPSGDAAATRIDKSLRTASDRDRAETEYRKGLDLARQGRVGDAIAGFQAALREDASHVPARNALLSVLVENRRLAEAEEVLRTGIRQQPVNLSWVVSLARLRIEQSDPAGAWEIFQAHAQAGVASADFQGVSGVALQKLGRMKEAGEHYQAATRIAPANPSWWVGLGLSMEAEGRPDAARDAFLKARGLPGLSPELTAFVEQRLR